MIVEVPYIRPGLTWEEVGALPIWDATTSTKVSECPRRAEYAVIQGLGMPGDARPLRMGRAVHSAMALHYAGATDDEMIAAALQEFGSDESGPSDGKFQHLHAGNLEIVLRNFLQYARKDPFTPKTVQLDQLDLSQVVAARWQTLERDGTIVLGESKIIMEFEVNGKPFYYAGRPDLPIHMGGSLYVMDHKTTSAFLSEWYFERYRFSNQLRGYCEMLTRLLGQEVVGAYINGIYVGEKAALSTFKGTKFARYGPMTFLPSTRFEAIQNQAAWQTQLQVYKDAGYFPQNAGRPCQGCAYAKLCTVAPQLRPVVADTEFHRAPTAGTMQEFLDL